MPQSHPDTNITRPTQNRRKPLFDAVRRMLGRGFKQSEVDAMDDAWDTGLETRVDGHPNDFTKDRVTSGPSVPAIRRKTDKDGNHITHPMRISEAGTALIKRFEGCARLRRDGTVEAYPDPGTGDHPWTIGWGATGVDDQTSDALGHRIGPGTVWTQAQCDARLARDLKRYARDVAQAIGDTPTTQSQFDAMVSFHYNTGAIARATLTKRHNAGDHAAATVEFARWNKAGGRVLKGLVRRRAEEAKLYAS
ncbi:glycoside hydrolase family protein [Erythrobacter sp. Alg231-14]|uniref:glycoside hydrolase family protein n=1 Tax=Erythrobacter sp. Alg231-14 TaxID=1922225 RepID=UPI000D54EAFE